MKKIILAFLVLYTFGNYSYSQQTVYSENFNAGFGGWANTDLVAPWGNTTDGFGLTNIWQNSDAESGMGTNNCGVANAGNPTLYMGADGMVSGAAYSSTANTNRRIASPNISTVGYSNMTMGFKFIGNGCETRDRAYFQYSIDGGTNWVSPTAAPTSSNPAMGTGGNMGNLKSTICTGGQGRWTEITWDLPASCENIADLKIAFVWQNSDGATCSGTPTDPSFAVDDIIIIMPTSVTPPVADFSASKTSICAGECVDFTDLSTNSPTSWAWTFTGAATTSSNIQNPTSICYNTPGQYTVELIATNAGGSDTETKTNYITVHALPTVNLGPDTTLCSGDILVLDAGAGFSDYVWTPSGATQTINVTTSGAYSVTVTDANTCQGSDAILVNVVNQADATILSSGSYCLNATSFNLTATDPGGTWSGPGITNPSAGTFDPGTAGVGVHTIYYEIFGLCGDIDSVNITVHALPTVNLGPDTIICSGDILVLDAGAGFSGYAWTPSGTTQTINVTTSGTYSVTVTDANTCQGSDAIVVNVVTQADATILSSGSYCLNAAWLNLIAVNSGGTWSGPGIINAAAGTFDPGTAGVGVHTIYYEIFGLCGDIDSVNITVHALPTVNLGPDTTLCSGDILVLDAGAGFSGYAWTPSGTTQAINVTSSGTYSVTVTDANTCQGSDAIVVTVINQADATILSSGSYCLNVASFNLTATDPGGTWSGPGIINAAAGTFDPGTAGVGVHTIYYEIFGLCGDIDSVKITVHALPTVNLGPDTTICSGDILVLDAGAGYTYNWSPSGSNQTFNVTSSGTYSVTVTDGNTCQDTDAITVTVIDQQDATITTAGPFCDNNSPVQLQALDGGGSWTGTVGLSNSGMFDPSAAGTGTHTITHTIAGACGDTDTRDIIVNEAPMVSITHNDESCIGADDGGAAIIIIDGTSPYSISWKPGGEDSDSLIGLAPGTYEVLVIDQKGCRDSVDVIILAGIDDCLPPHVYVPNIFSPNGDGQNDALYVRGEGIEYMEFFIYNRWGEKVFETTDKAKGWNGAFRGALCEAGVYSYILRITWNGSSKRESISGTITLVR